MNIQTFTRYSLDHPTIYRKVSMGDY